MYEVIFVVSSFILCGFRVYGLCWGSCTGTQTRRYTNAQTLNVLLLSVIGPMALQRRMILHVSVLVAAPR